MDAHPDKDQPLEQSLKMDWQKPELNMLALMVTESPGVKVPEQGESSLGIFS